MKKNILLVVIAMLFSVSLFSQESICGILPLKNGKITYEGIVSADSISAIELYKNTKLWVAKNFVSSKNVIVSDLENSLITIQAYFNKTKNDSYGFNLKLEFKDQRYKYTLTNTTLLLKMSTGVSEIELEKIPACYKCMTETLIGFDKDFKFFLDDLKNNINGKTDNW